MPIFVDADACPNVIKDILCKAAHQRKVMTTFVANRYVKVAPSPFIKSIVVEAGFDVADNEIVRLSQAGDLIITADIPLASEVIDKGALALSPRGELFTASNIKARLNVRDFMDTMRSSGIQSGGPPPLNNQDKQQFGNELDKWITKALRT
ncbi:YaiI/YqxD family protein [Thalassotalea euphylliae]|uniref:YaiI/YqxD family protein n=1 Tax=Thalassotalea euphylliae TaxID=1655234 RepID=UPI0036373FCF